MAAAVIGTYTWTCSAWFQCVLLVFDPSRSFSTKTDEPGSCLLYLNQKEVFWYELPGTLRGLTGGDRRLYLPSGVMNQVYDTKNRVVKA